MGELDDQGLDEQAKADVRAERRRYAAALAALRTDDAATFLAEFERHRETVGRIMLEVDARRSAPPADQ